MYLKHYISLYENKHPHVCLAALLGIENAKEIIDLTWDYRARWRFIGRELGIDEGTLEAIAVDERKVDDRLSRVITTWLKKIKPKPTQSAIMAALKSEHVSGTEMNNT